MDKTAVLRTMRQKTIMVRMRRDGLKKYIMLGMGYVSSKHLTAIKETGGELIAYHDIHDVVGHVDSKFINALYYPEFIHLDCFVDRYQKTDKIDYAVINLPNHLHNPACRWALNHGMDVIVEKPLVLQEKNLDELAKVEKLTGHRINTILQMRHHESTRAIIDEVKKPAYVKIVYSTPRGQWFKHGSWKADPLKTGGLCAAIGIHLFDICCLLFGKWLSFEVHMETHERIVGVTEHLGATVEWDLSVEPDKEPTRIFNINGKDYDYTKNFTELHTESYRHILNGNGFGIEDARDAVRLVEMIRNCCQFPRYSEVA